MTRVPFAGPWNPYYVAYALAHGRAPRAMLDADVLDWPGGKMCGFILWMSTRWAQWRKLHDIEPDAVLSDLGHADFAGWLAGRSFQIGEGLEGPISSKREHAAGCSIDLVIGEGRDRRRPCVCSCGASAA